MSAHGAHILQLECKHNEVITIHEYPEKIHCSTHQREAHTGSPQLHHDTISYTMLASQGHVKS